ncbi:heparinase II/III family protein [Natronomonas gomsonensis]|uniref:alginate lyase family protein n=1 Tax=Natronomonas gomsonensis TaxID=1046043 RepID=UPI00227B388D|nr:alginate lyase family protein [Natronomonas gomsonensis]MCY4732138.1 heparinase II/III family protein [Natronomonas gomsonensis]
MTDHLTLVGTALNKQPRQLFGIATRTVKSSVLPRLPVDVDSRYEDRIPGEFTPHIEPIRENTVRLQESTVEKRETYESQAEAAVGGEITFLNETMLFEDGEAVSVDANSVLAQSLHWQLKCWGFEHLKSVWLSSHNPSEVSDDDIAVHRSWLDDWMGDHPIAADTRYLRRYWMPHSVCLRILNWARYDSLFADRLGEEFRKAIRRFIYKNAAFLSDNVEYGVGGNHLVENAVALVVAGVYADEPAWRRQGHRIFERAAENQFFEDGGHIERSPMYHLIVLQRFLTAVDLLEAIGEASEPIRRAAADAARFVEVLRPPDDRIPLLNDSVFGEALPLVSCLTYSRSIGIETASNSNGEIHEKSLPESGFYWFGDGDTRLLVAAHEVTVPHLPGHAHVHPGQICLWVDGKRVLTDTGVFEYAAGPRRQRARSIRSHNTVQVGDAEPVRLASSFWLSGSLDPKVEYWENSRLRMAYDVGGIGRPTYDHEREIESESDGWRITDQVGCEEGPILSRLHVHPECETVFENDEGYVTIEDSGETQIAKVEAFDHTEIDIETAAYYPAYGKEQSRSVIVIHRERPGRFGARLRITDAD